MGLFYTEQDYNKILYNCNDWMNKYQQLYNDYGKLLMDNSEMILCRLDPTNKDG